MKFPSIKILEQEFIRTFKRFPLALLCSILATYVCCSFISNNKFATENVMIHLLMTFYLGMISFVSITLFFNRYTIRETTQWIINLLIVGLMIVYFKMLPDEEISLQVTAQFFILTLAAHLSVAFSPYLVTLEINGFWQYNKTLFLRFITSSLYSIVLYVGLALAFLAIDNLFDVNIPDKTYGYLACLIGVVFNTWFFLAGIPVNIQQLQINQDYPKGLRVFTQFVLLPLVTIYLVILYTYTAKILLTMHWPHGWVSYLVIGFSTAGILALLLVWPLREDENHKWISNYTKGFFMALFPLIVLLCFAIGRRVVEYGITENRYFIIALAIWLFANAIYFLVSKRKNIKVIPMSLFVVALLSGFGPINGFSISKRSQLNRLEKILVKNNILENGKVKRSKNKTFIDDQIAISSIIYYMTIAHSYKDLQPYFYQNLDSLIHPEKGKYVFKPAALMDLMGLEYNLSKTDYAENPHGYPNYHYSSKRQNYLKVTGYDFEFPIKIYCYNESGDHKFSNKVLLDSIPFDWNYKKGDWFVNLKYDSDSTLNIDLKPLLFQLKKMYGTESYEVSPNFMTIEFANETMSGLIKIEDINTDISHDSTRLELNSLEAEILLKVALKK